MEWRETKNKGLCGVLASNNSQEDKARFSEPPTLYKPNSLSDLVTLLPILSHQLPLFFRLYFLHPNPYRPTFLNNNNNYEKDNEVVMIIIRKEEMGLND